MQKRASNAYSFYKKHPLTSECHQHADLYIRLHRNEKNANFDRGCFEK